MEPRSAKIDHCFAMHARRVHAAADVTGPRARGHAPHALVVAERESGDASSNHDNFWHVACVSARRVPEDEISALATRARCHRKIEKKT